MFVKLDFKVVDGIHCSIEPEQITEKHGMTFYSKISSPFKVQNTIELYLQYEKTNASIRAMWLLKSEALLMLGDFLGLLDTLWPWCLRQEWFGPLSLI